MKIKTLLADLFALLLIFVVNCAAGLFIIFFFAMRAPGVDIDWASFFQIQATSFQIMLGTTLLFWLAYLFYFKKQL